jgi:hypothetical protein
MRAAEEPETRRLRAENGSSQRLLTFVTLAGVKSKDKKLDKFNSFQKLLRDADLSGGKA